MLTLFFLRLGGPFEYWIRKTRQLKLEGGTKVMDDCITELCEGRMPALLRRLSRAAAGFTQDE